MASQVEILRLVGQHRNVVSLLDAFEVRHDQVYLRRANQPLERALSFVPLCCRLSQLLSWFSNSWRVGSSSSASSAKGHTSTHALPRGWCRAPHLTPLCPLCTLQGSTSSGHHQALGRRIGIHPQQGRRAQGLYGSASATGHVLRARCTCFPFSAVKPENLLLDCADEKRALVKLADFGLSHLLGPGTTHMTTVCGTWAYSAPEVRINRQKYTHKVDTWSLGVIMFVVLSGYRECRVQAANELASHTSRPPPLADPFDPDGVAPEEELQRNIKYGNVDFDDDVWTGVSGAAQDLIRRLLVVDPRRRYDTGDILAHPWITKNRHLWEEPPTGNHPPTARKADTTREAQAVGPSSMGSPPAGEPDSSAAGVGGAFILSPTADSHDEAIAAAANGGVGTFAKHHSSSSSAVAAAAAAPASLVPEASGEAERVPQAFGAMRHATAESGARTSSDLPQQSDADESCVGAVSVTPFMVAEAPTHLPPRHAASTQSSAAGRKIVLPPLESASTGAESKQTSAFQGVGPVLRTPSGRDIHFDTIQSTASAPSQARSQAAAEATASPPD